MGLWDTVAEGFKKFGKAVGTGAKRLYFEYETKNRILNKFEMSHLKSICKDYGVGEPSSYEEDPITGKKTKITLKREDFIGHVRENLSLEQLRVFAEKHRIDIFDIVRTYEENLRKLKEEAEQKPSSLAPTKEIKTEAPVEQKPSKETKFDNILHVIMSEFEPEDCRDENELEKQLYQYLKSKIPNKIERQVRTAKGTIDLVIDNRFALELKIADNKNKLRDLIGQLWMYKEAFKDIGVVILDVGKLSKGEIKEFSRNYEELGARPVIITGVLSKKPKYRGLNIKISRA